MIEVFKTNVEVETQAALVLDHIHRQIQNCRANFDLQDCDRILRIQSASDIYPELVIDLLKQVGFDAEVLPDEIPEPPTLPGYRSFSAAMYRYWGEDILSNNQ